MNYQAWIWSELLAFDNTKEDQGVKEYFKKTGFVPQGISLLLSSPDFILLHEGVDKEIVLAPDICSRLGHERNEERQRQEWTNYQLESLVNNIHEAGSEIYISVFAGYNSNKFHEEWLSKHPEVMHVDWRGRAPAINPLSKIGNGRFFEDFFIEQTIKACADYGFDGWHGPDGWGPGPGNANIWNSNCSDDMMGQFRKYYHGKLPEIVTCDSNVKLPTVSTLQERMKWIWANIRKEWMEFNIARWEKFWEKMVKSLHENGKKALINSAWTRAGFEAMYRYGIDYKRIAKTGVDYMIVETSGAMGFMNENIKREWHYDLLAMLMEIKAIAPQIKLLFLNAVKDVVEEFDFIRHVPTLLERDLYSLANMYYKNSKNSLCRIVEGFLVCLGDGMSSEEWKWLKERWDLSFSITPQKGGDVTFLWSDNAFYRHLDDYISHGTWSSHKIAYCLLERGIQIQTIARIEDVLYLQGPLLVPYSHLLSEIEFKKLLNYKNGPIIFLGDLDYEMFPKGTITVKCGNITCAIVNSSVKKQSIVIPYLQEKFIENKIPLSFKEDISWAKIPIEFWNITSDYILNSIARYNCEKDYLSCFSILENNQFLGLMTTINNGKIYLAAKNTGKFYLKRKIDMTKTPNRIKIHGKYPSTELTFENNSFTIRIPPYGIVIVEITI